MPYIDLAGLSRYAFRQKDRLEREYALLRDMQWTRSEKAGAVSLWPAGGTPLKPGVDFLFSETPPASGDKGPSNPSTITGVSSVNVGRIGKNQLLKVNSFDWIDLAVTANSDGSYTFNGTISTNSYSARAFTDSSTSFSSTKSSVHLDSTKTYTLSAELVSGSVTLADPNGSKPSIVYGYSDTAGGSMLVYLPLTVGKNSQSNIAKTTGNGEFIARVQQFQTATFTNAVYRFQLEEGNTATDFEAPMLPADANHDIPLGSTYYGGTIDLATGVMTVTHAKNIVNGDTIYSTSLGLSENVTSYALAFYPSPGRQKSQTTADRACDLLPIGGSDSNRVLVGNNSSNIQIWLSKSLLNLSDGLSFSDVKPAFSAFFAEHPMNIVYKMETPQTVQLTPTEILSLTQSDKYTPRLNTVYTDAQAVQVGYVKSPIRDEYELQQAVIAQGGNV